MYKKIFAEKVNAFLKNMENLSQPEIGKVFPINQQEQAKQKIGELAYHSLLNIFEKIAHSHKAAIAKNNEDYQEMFKILRIQPNPLINMNIADSLKTFMPKYFPLFSIKYTGTEEELLIQAQKTLLEHMAPFVYNNTDAKSTTKTMALLTATYDYYFKNKWPSSENNYIERFRMKIKNTLEFIKEENRENELINWIEAYIKKNQNSFDKESIKRLNKILKAKTLLESSSLFDKINALAIISSVLPYHTYGQTKPIKVMSEIACAVATDEKALAERIKKDLLKYYQHIAKHMTINLRETVRFNLNNLPDYKDIEFYFVNFFQDITNSADNITSIKDFFVFLRRVVLLISSGELVFLFNYSKHFKKNADFIISLAENVLSSIGNIQNKKNCLFDEDIELKNNLKELHKLFLLAKDLIIPGSYQTALMYKQLIIQKKYRPVELFIKNEQVYIKDKNKEKPLYYWQNLFGKAKYTDFLENIKLDIKNNHCQRIVVNPIFSKIEGLKNKKLKSYIITKNDSSKQAISKTLDNKPDFIKTISQKLRVADGTNSVNLFDFYNDSEW